MNYKDQRNNALSNNEKISSAILFFLVLMRLVDQYLPIGIFGSNIPNWFGQWYLGVAFILTLLIIWLNRHKLAAINIDRPFIVVVILGGFLYALYLMPAIGMLVGIATGLMVWAYQTNHLIFKNPVPFEIGTGLLVFLTVPLALAPAFIFRFQLRTPLDFDLFFMTLQAILMNGLASIVFEEVLFRGALWAYLRSRGLTEQAASYVQAFLFWIAHHRLLSLSSPFAFWVALPLEAILLGLITRRSKSLTPSTIGHFLFNFIGQLLLNIFR